MTSGFGVSKRRRRVVSVLPGLLGADRVFSCGVRVSRQIVRFGRSQTSPLARLCCLRGMFVGAAIFAGSICALSRNARVGAEFRSGKCEFAHVMGCYESKEHFRSLRACASCVAGFVEHI